jgi:hypothetical protein
MQASVAESALLAQAVSSTYEPNFITTKERETTEIFVGAKKRKRLIVNSEIKPELKQQKPELM